MYTSCQSSHGGHKGRGWYDIAFADPVMPRPAGPGDRGQTRCLNNIFSAPNNKGLHVLCPFWNYRLHRHRSNIIRLYEYVTDRIGLTVADFIMKHGRKSIGFKLVALTTPTMWHCFVHLSNQQITGVINTVWAAIIQAWSPHKRFKPLKGSGVRRLHFEVFSAIQV